MRQQQQQQQQQQQHDGGGVVASERNAPQLGRCDKDSRKKSHSNSQQSRLLPPAVRSRIPFSLHYPISSIKFCKWLPSLILQPPSPMMPLPLLAPEKSPRFSCTRAGVCLFGLSRCICLSMRTCWTINTPMRQIEPAYKGKLRYSHIRHALLPPSPLPHCVAALTSGMSRTRT